MSTTTYETVTTFYYEIQPLIDRVQLEVLYKVRNRADIIGLGDNTIIDAELLVKEYLSSIAHDVFSKLLSPWGRTLEDLDDPQDPFEYNETFTHPETEAETENCIIYRVIFPDYSDENTKEPIHRAIEDALVSYCVYQWLMDSNIQGWERYEYEHLKKMDNLRDLMTRRINLQRTYKWY